MHIAKSVFLLVISFSILNVINADERINFINGGYEGIVVAINKDIKPENSAKLIENLKALFTRTSEFLYNATEGRAWFRNITLIVPESWPISNADKIPSCFSDAHIRVGPTDSLNGDQPYTLQSDECGKPGQYIHLTDNFILNLNDKTLEDFPRPDKYLVREWAHFRYGVYDEHGLRNSDQFPAFYLSEGKIHPTSCSNNISGWAEKPDGSKCVIYKDGTVDYDCEFYVDKEARVEASLMYSPDLDSINKFCTHDSGSREHNKVAPNQQNVNCDGRSTWEVIMDSNDFKEQKSIPPKPPSLAPTFIYRKSGQNNIGKFVLVLDISGSMQGSKIQSLNAAAKTFINDIPINNYLGIVSFSSNASILYNLTQITDTSVRAKLAAAVPPTASGGTRIDLGLLKGLEALKQAGQNTEGSTIVLVTDGEESESEIVTVIPTLKNAKVKVMCLGVGPEASHVLEKITKETGGRIDQVADGANAAIYIDNIFTSFIVCEDEDNSISILNKLVDLKEKVTNILVPLDKELGKNTVITISVGVGYQTHWTSLLFDVISPNGTKYTCGAQPFVRDDVLRRCQLKLAQTEIGNYTVVMTKNEENIPIQANVKITSEARDPNNQPIAVKAWLSKIDINHGIDQPTIYVQVKKGSFPVVNANVTAIIDSDKNEHFQLEVKDSGNYDGVYVAKFKNANSNGRYSVIADVSYTNTTRLVIVNKGDSRPFRPQVNNKTRIDKPSNVFDPGQFIINETRPVKQVKVEPLEPFIRVKMAGSFQVNNYSETNVKLEEVNDLKVALIRDDLHLLDLQWTEHDDDNYKGVTREIDMRISKTKEALLDEKSFLNQTKIDASMLMFGGLKSFKAGELQELGVKLSDQFWPANSNGKPIDIYIALRTIDANGNKAKISNIANAHIGYDLSKNPPKPPENLEPITEILETFSVNKATISKSFTIPEKYGVITNWKITTGKIENFNFTLNSPDKKVYDENYSNFKKDIENHLARYHFEDSLTGIWELIITYNDKIKTYEDEINIEIISSRRKNSYF